MDVATIDTHLTIEDLLQGYDSLIEDMIQADLKRYGK